LKNIDESLIEGASSKNMTRDVIKYYLIYSYYRLLKITLRKEIALL
jgi:hypothetical protein